MCMSKSLKIIDNARKIGNKMCARHNSFLSMAFLIYPFYDGLYRILNRSTENIKFESVACISLVPHGASTIRPVFNELRRQGIQCKWVSKLIDNGVNYLYISSEIGFPKERINQTIFIPHGIGYEFPNLGHLKFKKLLLSGLHDLKLFENKPFRKDQLELIGYPKSDILFSPGKELIMASTKNRFYLDFPYEKTILYAPGWVAPPFLPSKSSFDKSILFIIAMSQDLKMNLIIKAHPHVQKSSSEEIYLKAQQLSKKIKNIFWIDKDVEDITPLYLFSDVLVSDHSSVLYEFMPTDKPSIQLTNIPSKKLLFEGTIKSSLENLPNTIIRIIDNPSEYLCEQRKQVKKRIFNPDGHASERAVAIIKKLMEKGKE